MQNKQDLEGAELLLKPDSHRVRRGRARLEGLKGNCLKGQKETFLLPVRVMQSGELLTAPLLAHLWHKSKADAGISLITLLMGDLLLLRP